MTQYIAIIIFKSTWGLLFLIALVAQILFADKSKRKAGLFTNLLVITPFVVVLGLFYLERWVGIYFGSTPVTRISGTVLICVGMVSYILSHFYLRRNWSLSASIKEGHKLISSGSYKLVRHPMYSAMTLVVFGSGLLIANYLILLSTPVIFIIYYIRARKEETLLREEFPEYNQYIRRTKMLIPGIL
jgi:protein-S-isoprenylcysteine O-methyltransferase Ste14